MMQQRSKPMGMAIGKAIQDALNEQITREFFASNLYLSMSAYCDNLSLQGFAHWLRLQADEERQHGLKIYDYILERSGQVQIGTIDPPSTNFPSMLGVFQQALEHEQLVSSQFHQLYRQAQDAQDFTTKTFVEWFLMEQVEEEKSATEIVDWLTMIGDKHDALVLLDREMAKRQTEPAP